MDTRLIIGAMSGTSADGVDVAIVRVGGRGLAMTAELVSHRHVSYEPLLRQSIFDARSSGNISLSNLGEMGRRITNTYADAAIEAMEVADLLWGDITAIAVHGQTLFHSPPTTIQWFDPSLLAYETDCQVVSDFRRADCAAGGQGAPLVPFADYVLFRHPILNRALLNIGGIANLTWLGAGADFNAVVAYDVGPGNCISDDLMRKHFPGGMGFDAGGKLAASGKVNQRILQAAVKSGFFWKSPPKSTDGPQMLELWEHALPAATRQNPSLEDLLATACEMVRQGVKIGLDSISEQLPDELIVSGGGTENEAIMAALQDMCGSACRVRLVDEFGIPSAAKEAVAFALLGAATLDGIPSNVPSVTGADRPVILGSITPKP